MAWKDDIFTCQSIKAKRYPRSTCGIEKEALMGDDGVIVGQLMDSPACMPEKAV